jgi:succinyl-CoA synthetase alpha subunit
MSILLDGGNRVLVQGITGHMGTFFAQDARKYGTQIVAGVSPGREGARVGEVPVFGSVRAACEATRADTAIVFVPPMAVLGATLEAIEAGCRLIVATADELPVQDAIGGESQRGRVRRSQYTGPDIAREGQARFHAVFLLHAGRHRGHLAQRIAVVRVLQAADTRRARAVDGGRHRR